MWSFYLAKEYKQQKLWFGSSGSLVWESSGKFNKTNVLTIKHNIYKENNFFIIFIYISYNKRFND